MWNSGVQRGDVLLLRSRDADAISAARARLSLRAQALLRRRHSASFTHVAVVIQDGLIADATTAKDHQDVGVNLRPWSALEPHYDIDKCVVARCRRVAEDEEAANKLFKRAVYYHKRPYGLQSLLSRRPFGSGDEMVCSQFVTLVLAHARIQVSAKPARQTLPIDIDVFTSTSADWERIPLRNYRLFSGFQASESELREYRTTFRARRGESAGPRSKNRKASTGTSLDSPHLGDSASEDMRRHELKLATMTEDWAKQVIDTVDDMHRLTNATLAVERLSPTELLGALRASLPRLGGVDDDASFDVASVQAKWERLFLQPRREPVFSEEEFAPAIGTQARRSMLRQLHRMMEALASLNAANVAAEENMEAAMQSPNKARAVGWNDYEAAIRALWRPHGPTEDTTEADVESLASIGEEIRRRQAAGYVVDREMVESFGLLSAVTAEYAAWVKVTPSVLRALLAASRAFSNLA